MIRFVNAKLNLGLYVTERRADGYHNLQTLFYPVGLHNGTPENPEPFCDILEITPEIWRGDLQVASRQIWRENDFQFHFTGNSVDCPEEKNLVVKAAKAFRDALQGNLSSSYTIRLEKHLPDGAGLGGGSADCAFTLSMLNELEGNPLTREQLIGIAASLGADCPIFILNEPAIGEGIGEVLEPVPEILKGWWCAIVKPPVYVSTAEAFCGINPHMPQEEIRITLSRPIEEWKERLHNQFEDAIFPLHPELAEVKESLYRSGATYASMSGSGASLFGLFLTREAALKAISHFSTDYFSAISLL